jgi:uncharacterized membrane protein
MKTKLFAILVIALFALSTFGSVAFAATTTDEKIAITDVNYEDPVAPGNTLPVEVQLSNKDTVKDFQEVQVKVWLVDSFGDRLTDKVAIGPMQIQQDSEKTVTLNLNIPADAQPGDYKLMVEASGVWEKGTARITITPATEYKVEVQQNDDAFFIQDIRTSKAEYSAGDNVDVALTVMNNGVDDQDNVVVSVAIPELNVAKSLKIFGTLFAGNSQTVYMTFALPKDADGGIYTMTATAGNSVAKYSTSANLVLKKPIQISSLDTSSLKNTNVEMTLDVGKSDSVQLAISNKDTVTKSYEITSSQNDWATITASPAKFDLRPGQTQAVKITVTADKAGQHSADIIVAENGKAISAVTIDANAKTPLTSAGAAIAVLAIILAAIIVYFQFYKNGSNKAKAQHIYY